MEEDLISSNEEELDEEELEVALYSQIHFDPVTTDSFAQNTRDFLANFVQPSFQVGVRSFTPKKTKRVSVKKAETKQPSVFNLNFISFSDDASSSEVKDSPKRSQQKDCPEECIEAPQINSDKNSENVLPKESSEQDQPIADTSSNILHFENKKLKETDDNVLDEVNDDDNILLTAVTAIDESEKATSNDDLLVTAPTCVKKVRVNTAESKKNERGCASTSEENAVVVSDDPEDEPMPADLLSFTITKKPKVVIVPKPVPTEESEVEINIKAKNVRKRVQTPGKTPAKNKKGKLPKLEEFLSISPEVTSKDSAKSKKKKVSKQEAAVQQRKPPVIIRRAPAVVVKYHQDSDTNTDYSDSEDSKTSSPVKVRKVDPSTKSSKKVPVKPKLTTESSDLSDSSDEDMATVQDEPSINSETDVKGENVDRSVEESSDSDSDEEGEIRSNKEDQSGSEEDSETISSSGEDDMEMSEELITHSGLDFNLTGGVNALLKTPVKDDPDQKWAIDGQDRMGPSRNVLTNRYFNPKKVKCRNCNEEGHFAVTCTKERKIVCIFCGTQGHHLSKCPDAFCFNCSCPGHKYTDCPSPKRNRFEECDRCWMKGHSKDICPDQWRQYHLTIGLDSKKIVKLKGDQNSSIYCYNCGGKGHLGFECHAERVNRFVLPLYPYVAEYDEIRNKKDKRDADKRSKHRERKDEYDRGKKRKAEKSDDRDRKASKHRREDDKQEVDAVDNLNIRIDQRKSKSSNKASNRKVSKKEEIERKDSYQGSSRDLRETFVSGSTRFMYQEPSDLRFSSRRAPQSSFPGNATDQYNRPPPSRMNFDSFDGSSQYSADRYNSNLDDYSVTDERRSWKSMNDETRSGKSMNDEKRSGKSRKMKQKRGRGHQDDYDNDDDDLMEDMERHQVSHNEWWKGGDDMEDVFDGYFESQLMDTSSTSRKNKKNLKKNKQHSSNSPSTSGTRGPRPHSHSKKVSKDRSPHHSSAHEQYEHHHRPYHHHHHHQNFNNNCEEDYISLSSRRPPRNNNRSAGPNHGGKKNWKGKSHYNAKMGKNGFKARDWVMSMY